MPEKDLPKAPADLREAVKSFNPDDLKHSAETEEKIVTPGMQEIAQEKTEAVREELFSFDSSKLKHTETKEANQMPSMEAIAQEKTSQVRDELSSFDTQKLKPTQTAEKVHMPTKEEIEQEKAEANGK